MTQKNLNGRQQRWLTHISKYDYEIEYQPGAKNFLADYLSRIHDVNSGPEDITLKDPTLNEKESTPSTRSLSLHTHYTSSCKYTAESANSMTQTNHSPTLTSRESIYRTSLDYLMNEISSHAVTRSQKPKTPPLSSSSIISKDSRISIGNTRGNTITLPIPSEMQRRHSAISWRSCTDDNCEDHKEDKIGARYWPKDPKTRKQSKRDGGNKRTDFGPTLSNEKSPTALPDIPLLSEYAPPIWMQESIIDTPPMASPAFEPLYRQPYLSPGEAEWAQSFICTLRSTLIRDCRCRVLKALELDPLYARVKQTDNKLHYSIDSGLLMAQNTNGYQNLYIPVGPLENRVSLRDFILRTAYEGLGHFSAHKSYNYAACFFWWPQMRQDFIIYCRSCDKCQINNGPTTLPAGRSLTLPDPDDAYLSLAIDFTRPFNKSSEYTTVMVIMDHFTSYTHLVPLKDAAISEKAFKKLERTIFDVHGLLLSIVLDQDSQFTSKFWSWMMKSLGIQVWMATQYHHQTNGQVERRIRTLKPIMRNFVNKRQNNWSGTLPTIAAAMNEAPHDSLGISPYQALYGRPWKIFNPVQRSASKIPAVDEILTTIKQ